MEQVCTEQDTAKIQERLKQKTAHVEANLKLQMQRAYKSDGAAIKSSEWHVLETQAAGAGLRRDAVRLPAII